jgi:cell division protein FtsL
MTRKKQSRGRSATEFHTVKKLDNTRLVRHMEPVKMRNLYRTVALGTFIAAFFLLYIYQHFQCIDLSFQLEAARSSRSELAAHNSSLKLEIASLSNPKRIDMIARRQLGLSETLPTQVREYQPNVAPAGAEEAAVHFQRVSEEQ